ncbi:hypothetical protein QJS83_00280 [Bdellovibrio sp. 22V]|uniref:hypothetical protein n=1 Tax=Bdellovibrio TaxID=958 RepID=UPI002543E876|nr:hypothetical protein [Bdellovibrio sp. 22V]WII72302.1 hypothetical protein QJS83_00280 [Bdellovibrio sp. 22V]
MKVSILAVAIWLLVLDAHGAIPSSDAIRSPRSVRQQVDSYAELLEKEVAQSKNNRQRYTALNRVLSEIKSLRENSVPQGAKDEAHMDLLVSVLESIPQEKSFKRKDCLRYENDLINQYEPMAEEAPAEPAVKPGWTVLQSLCN